MSTPPTWIRQEMAKSILHFLQSCKPVHLAIFPALLEGTIVRGTVVGVVGAEGVSGRRGAAASGPFRPPCGAVRYELVQQPDGGWVRRPIPNAAGPSGSTFGGNSPDLFMVHRHRARERIIGTRQEELPVPSSDHVGLLEIHYQCLLLSAISSSPFSGR